MRDLHPMVVLSPRIFDERTGIVVGLLMTTAQSNDDNPEKSAITFKFCAAA